MMRGYATANGEDFEIGPVPGETRLIAGVPCRFIDSGLTARYVGEQDGFRVTALPPVNGSAWAVGVTAHGVFVCGAAPDLDDATTKALSHLAAALGVSILAALAASVAS